MELFFDVICGAIGNIVIKFVNMILRTKFVLGDGGKIVTGFVFLLVIIVLILLIVKLIGK